MRHSFITIITLPIITIASSIPKALPPPPINKTTSLLYEYSFKGETVLNGGAVKRKVEAVVEFEMLHYDLEGDVLGRYRMKKCTRGPCHSISKEEGVMVTFQQGTHQLISIHSTSEWN